MRSLTLAAFVISLLLQSTQAAVAEVDSSLNDEMFARQFDWAMYVEVKELPNYLNYKGSKLRPITKARTFLRSFPRDAAADKTKGSEVFEEFWYHKTSPLGSRRAAPIKLAKGTTGIIAIGDVSQCATHPDAATNVAIRTFVDLLLKGVDAQVLLIPAEYYQDVAAKLADYGFSSRQLPTSGRQIALTLRSYPPGKDEQIFLAQK